MNEAEIKTIIDKQKAFFAKGDTLKVTYRVRALKRLRDSIKKYETDINAALKKDLEKSTSESYMCEVGMVLSELSYMIKHTARYSGKKHVITPLAQFAARSYMLPSPYGQVLILSPWNYPFMLSLDPLIDAIAAGNTAIVKPSAYSPAVSNMIATIIRESFDEEYVAVVLGGRAENTCLLEQKFDYIFFTGSSSVGHEVMRKAAEHLTPVTLELGGKSPCIVDETARVGLAARRIVFGKYLNCGQTCVAPDYIYCHESRVEEFLDAVKAEIIRQYGENPLENDKYGKMINRKHFDRVRGLIDAGKIIAGGEVNENTLQIAPTVLGDVTWDDAVMKEEIFGPVMPVLIYKDIDEVISKVNANPHPLAFYYFTGDEKRADKVLNACSFGGGCVNDTIIHLATSYMGFGGVGASGTGSYHGKKGFDTFSHYKSIVDKKTWLDMPMRYQPYKGWKDALIKMFLK